MNLPNTPLPLNASHLRTTIPLRLRPLKLLRLRDIRLRRTLQQLALLRLALRRSPIIISYLQNTTSSIIMLDLRVKPTLIPAPDIERVRFLVVADRLVEVEWHAEVVG